MATANRVNFKKSDAQPINIQSFIRVRPLGSKEKKANFEFGKKEVTIKNSTESSKIHKTLLYDRVFGEDSKQIVVYNTVVKPMIKEVLQGYNCTVFAYGQTGSGKTYTMTGLQDSNSAWEENIHAGIVPRAMHDIFTELSVQACEYQVSVSYMELYNEKLRSLLKDADDIDIKLIDDLEGGVIVKGLLPTPVKNKEEAFKLLQQGTEKRQVAATQMNMNSSRSHTIFTINVNIKENAVAGKDDVLRCGKLHLVDLAGSENVAKSGASEIIHKSAMGVNKRLAEASNINKSLLTLGRVITSLTENNSHVPYRESKLTRFLQDSLGGKTKTCIIGTISPAQSNLDETENTLNYAFKARSIKNKPVKNQTISKRDFMQVASEEIMKLKKDLEAVRQGEGFYISKESHEEMITRMKELDDQVKDWHEKYSRIKESYEQTKELFSSISSDYEDKCAEYEELDNLFRIESQKCQDKMSEFAKEIVVREYFIKEYKKTEDRLTEQAKTCKSVLENLLEQSDKLHDKIDRKQANESENIETLSRYKEDVSANVSDFQCKLNGFLGEEKQFLKQVQANVATVYNTLDRETEQIKASLSSFENELKDISMSRNEKITEKLKELTCEVGTCKALGEVTSERFISLYREFIQSHILPTMKNMQDCLSRVTKIAEKGKDHLSTYETRQTELVSEIADNHQALMKSVMRTVSKIDAFAQQSLQASSSTRDICTKTDLTSEKLDEMLKILMSVKADVESVSSELKSKAEIDESAANEAKEFGADIITDLELHGSKHCTLMEAMGEVSKERTVHQSALTNQIGDEVNSLLAEGSSKLEQIESDTEEHVEQMQKLQEKQKDTSSKLELSVSHLIQYSSETNQACRHTMEKFVEDVTTNLSSTVGSIEVHLREQNNLLSQKLHQISEKPELTEAILSLEQKLKTVNYSEYTPLGSTPQRISKDKLMYPRRFDSTAPRDELVKKLRESYPETESVTNDNLNLKKHLPAGPFFNGEIQSSVISPCSVKSSGSSDGSMRLDVECTPQTRTRLLRRKSTSMPNLLEDEFVVPSSVENKENTRVLSARRPVKTKIPDVVRKKKALSAVQDYSNVIH